MSKKLTGLTRATVVQASDLMYMVLNPNTTPLSRGVLLSDVLKGRVGSVEVKESIISGFAEEASPGAGHLLLASVGGALKKVDIGNMAGIDWNDPIDADLIPDTDGIYTIGNADFVWAQVFMDLLNLNGQSIDAFLDENDMASNSATALISQQSSKAYADLVRLVTETEAFTISAAHNNKTALVDSATDVPVTFPSNATFNAPIGTQGVLEQVGNGRITFDDDSGAATLLIPVGFNLKTAGKESPVYYKKVAADTWRIAGDLEVATKAPTIVTTTPRDLALTDNSIPVLMNLSSANQVNILAASSVPFPAGALIPVYQKGTGTTTINANSGVSLNGVVAGAADISGQNRAILLYNAGTDDWIITGDRGDVA